MKQNIWITTKGGTPVRHLGSVPGPGATAGTWQGQLLARVTTHSVYQYRSSILLHPDRKDFFVVFTLRVTRNLLTYVSHVKIFKIYRFIDIHYTCIRVCVCACVLWCKYIHKQFRKGRSSGALQTLTMLWKYPGQWKTVNDRSNQVRPRACAQRRTELAEETECAPPGLACKYPLDLETAVLPHLLLKWAGKESVPSKQEER